MTFFHRHRTPSKPHAKPARTVKVLRTRLFRRFAMVGRNAHPCVETSRRHRHAIRGIGALPVPFVRRGAWRRHWGARATPRLWEMVYTTTAGTLVRILNGRVKVVPSTGR